MVSVSDAIENKKKIKNDPDKVEGEDWVSGEIKGLSGKLEGKWELIRKLEGLTRKLEG